MRGGFAVAGVGLDGCSRDDQRDPPAASEIRGSLIEDDEHCSALDSQKGRQELCEPSVTGPMEQSCMSWQRSGVTNE